MNENLCRIFAKSAVDVFFCDKESREIIWANKEDLSDLIGKSAESLFENEKFPEKTGIASGTSGGTPYRYNIIEEDDCFIIEILNNNIASESFTIKAVRNYFHHEAVNVREYIHEINRNIENIEKYFDKEDMYNEMESLKNILGGCYNLFRPQRQREEYDYYITGKNLEPEIFSVNDFMSKNEENLRNFAGRKASVLRFEYDSDDLFINVSPERFSWIVFNTAYVIMKNINSDTPPSAKISISLSGNEVAVKIARNSEPDLESRFIEDCTRYRGGNPFENSFDFEVLKAFCKRYDCRTLAELTDKKLSSVTIFIPAAEKPEGYNLSSIKNVISDNLFSDMRTNIYEAANLKFIYR